MQHPGTQLRRQLAAYNLTTAATARMLLLSRQTLYEILAGKQAITPNVALRIGRLTGTHPRKWLELQLEHDLAVATAKMRDVLTQVRVLDEPW